MSTLRLSVSNFKYRWYIATKLLFCTMDTREFPNRFAEYGGEQLMPSDTGQLKIGEEYQKKLKTHIDALLKKLDVAVHSEVDHGDHSVYTGVTGIALLYFHLGNYHFKHDKDAQLQREYYEKALDLIARPLRHLKGRRVTFLCGDSGPLALGAVLYESRGEKTERDKCLNRLYGMHEEVLEDSDLPDELLYGRSGYLFAIQFLEFYLDDKSCVDTKIAEKIWKKITDSGQRLARRERSDFPLMYEWHGKKYLGAAHGLAGIFYTLMQYTQKKPEVFRKELDSLVRLSIEQSLTLRFPSGNYPSSIGSGTGDKLIHWCHGAPGWIHAFLKAYKIFGDVKYLEEAKKCGEVIWSRGLLKKGYGICHGTAGNAYAFLALFNVTDDQVHLYRAWKFAEWCFDYGKHGCRTADRPYSLFEGLAGTIYFLVDLQCPREAGFPAFHL